jgi:peroxiredoxin family protein
MTCAFMSDLALGEEISIFFTTKIHKALSKNVQQKRRQLAKTSFLRT